MLHGRNAADIDAGPKPFLTGVSGLIWRVRPPHFLLAMVRYASTSGPAASAQQGTAERGEFP
jgi:hypothetical protein